MMVVGGGGHGVDQLFFCAREPIADEPLTEQRIGPKYQKNSDSLQMAHLRAHLETLNRQICAR